jgi:uncharacterized membrane protein YgcG
MKAEDDMFRGKLLVISALVALSGNSFASAQSTAGPNPQVVYQTASLANQQTVIDMIAALKAAGFTYIEVRRTLLGRARFIAYSGSGQREVVINPTTGEVLRDLVDTNIRTLPPQASANAQAASNNGNGNNGNGNNGNGNGNNGNGNGNNGNSNGNGNSGNGNGNAGGRNN